MSVSVIDLNPRFNGKKGNPRTRSCIIGGLLIEGKEGREWWERTSGLKLAADHSQDLSVPMSLWKKLEKHGVHDVRRVCLIDPCLKTCHTDEPPADRAAWDFLVITHVERGPFEHDGINDCEYVVDEDRRPHPGVREAKVRDQLKDLFGIKSPGYKSLYSDLYYSWLLCG